MFARGEDMRPTAMIRDLLLLRLIQQAAKQEEQRTRMCLKDAAVELLDVEDREVDIRVKFRASGWEQEVHYPRAMLIAETNALIESWRRWGGVGDDMGVWPGGHAIVLCLRRSGIPSGVCTAASRRR
jgi:hypothetical protein